MRPSYYSGETGYAGEEWTVQRSQEELLCTVWDVSEVVLAAPFDLAVDFLGRIVSVPAWAREPRLMAYGKQPTTWNWHP